MVSLARPRLYAVLLGTFAAFALDVVAAGLFGVLSYTVAQRSKEIAAGRARTDGRGDRRGTVRWPGTVVAVANLLVRNSDVLSYAQATSDR